MGQGPDETYCLSVQSQLTGEAAENSGLWVVLRKTVVLVPVH